MFANSARPINGYGYEEVPHDGLALAMHESFCDWEIYLGNSEIMEANMYENWIMDTKHSQEQKIAMYEGVLGDAWNKIKEFFRAIANKIKSWFNAALKYFKTTFSSNANFLKQYKDELTSGKADEEFTFKAHKWDFAFAKSKTDDSKKVMKGVKDKFLESANAITKENLEDASTDVSKKVKEAKKQVDKDMYKGLKGEDAGNGGMSKYKTALVKAINGGEPKDCKGFGSKETLSLDDMIRYMEDGNDNLSSINDFATDISEEANNYADEVDKLVDQQTKDDSTDKSKWRKAINAQADIARYTLSYATATADVYKEQLNMCINECSNILRSFARYSPKKESGSGYRRRHGDVSLMEAWTSNW